MKGYLVGRYILRVKTKELIIGRMTSFTRHSSSETLKEQIFEKLLFRNTVSDKTLDSYQLKRFHGNIMNYNNTLKNVPGKKDSTRIWWYFNDSL